LGIGDAETTRILREYMIATNPEQARKFVDGAKKAPPERREELVKLREAAVRAAGGKRGGCAWKGCVGERKLRKCHLCGEEFCAFHIDRHRDGAPVGEIGAMGIEEDWRASI
jgi:hypothetical protein